jgi:hypothetical protein
VCVAIGARPVAEDSRAGNRERSFGQRCRIPVLDLLQRLDDAAAVGDGREEATDRAQIAIDRAVRLVEYRPYEPDDCADFLDAPARIVNGVITLWIADRVQFGDGGLELFEHDAPDLAGDRSALLQPERHVPPSWIARSQAHFVAIRSTRCAWATRPRRMLIKRAAASGT